MKFRALRDITSDYQDWTPSDWSARGSFTVKKKKNKKGIKCLCIYVRGHYFNTYKNWRKSVLGKAIVAYIERPKFNTYIRCMFFDTCIENNVSQNILYRRAVMKATIRLAFKRNDKENLAIYSNCSMCYRWCTYNFMNEWNNKMRYGWWFCWFCYDKYLKDEHWDDAGYI